MSTSLWGGRVAYDTADWAATSPVDTVQSRAIANNIAHACDSSGQVLECWTVSDANGVTRSMGPGTKSTLSWHSLYHGPHHTIRTVAGQSYTMRVRLRGRRVAASGSVRFGLAVLPAGDGAWSFPLQRNAFDPAYDNAEHFETSSATGAWLSPTDPFSSGIHGDGLLTLSESQLAQCLYSSGTSETLGGDAVFVTYHRVRVSVYVRQLSETPAMTPYLTGLYVAEYVGA